MERDIQIVQVKGPTTFPYSDTDNFPVEVYVSATNTANFRSSNSRVNSEEQGDEQASLLMSTAVPETLLSQADKPTQLAIVEEDGFVVPSIVEAEAQTFQRRDSLLQ